MLVSSVDQKLQEARDAGNIRTVLWEQRARLTITEVPVLDATVDLYFATRGQDFTVADSEGCAMSCSYDGIAEQDLPLVIPGAILWEVESLEDTTSGSRQRCWRLIFEDEE
jgi:hypothetical protein